MERYDPHEDPKRLDYWGRVETTKRVIGGREVVVITGPPKAIAYLKQLRELEEKMNSGKIPPDKVGGEPGYCPKPRFAPNY